MARESTPDREELNAILVEYKLISVKSTPWWTESQDDSRKTADAWIQERGQSLALACLFLLDELYPRTMLRPNTK
jgi:hypothetical protein